MAEREAGEAAAREAALREARPLVSQRAVPERPQSEPGRHQRRASRRRTIETGPVSRPAQQPQDETFRRTASLRVGKNRVPMQRLRGPPTGGDEVIYGAERSPANRLPATLPRSLEGMFPSLQSPVSSPSSVHANSPAAEELYAVPRDAMRAAQRDQIYAVPPDTLRKVPIHQQSSVGRSGTPQFALSPGGTPYAVSGAQERPRSPGTDSLSSQYDSSLSASHYSALQTPEGRRRLTNMFVYPPARPDRPSSVSSVLSASRETSDTPPSLPAKRSSAARLGRTEQPPFSGASLSLPRQLDSARRARQPERGYSDAPLTLPRQTPENFRARQPGRAMTLPGRSSEPLYPPRVEQRQRTYSEAPVPLPRKYTETLPKSEYDDYAVPQPRPRQLGETSPDQQSASGSEDTLVSSSNADDKDTADGSAPPNLATDPHDPDASPADIDRLTQWREPKSIGDWLRQDRTRQSEFDQHAQPAAGKPRWTRSELAPLPPTSSPPTRPGRITPTTSKPTSASATSAAEKRRAFLRSRETTEERLVRSLESTEAFRWATRPSSTDTATSEEHSSSGFTVLHDVGHSGETNSSRQDLPLGRRELSSKTDARQSENTLLSTKGLPHDENEPQTIAELGMRDTAATWVLEQCLQEVLSEEREVLRAQLIEWLEQKVAEEMRSANEALKETNAASKAVMARGTQITPNPTPVSNKPVSELSASKNLSAKVHDLEEGSIKMKNAETPAQKETNAVAKKDSAEVDHLLVPKSPEAMPPKLDGNRSSPFDVNSEETGRLGSPRFPDIDTPAPKSISREKFFEDMFQFQSPTTGERLVTLRLDATSEAPPSPGEKIPAKTPLFSSSVIIPSPERTLTVPQRIVIDVVAEPMVVQPPAIRVPMQPHMETEVKTRIEPSTAPSAPAVGIKGKEGTGKPDKGATTSPVVHAPLARTNVVASDTDNLSMPDYPSIREKADLVTSASPGYPTPQVKLPNTPTRREAIRPLSLLTPNSAGRATASPSTYLHRSPVEEPYPVLGDDLSSRRARLEARAAARESSLTSTDQSSQSDLSPEQPTPPHKLSNVGAHDSVGEAPRDGAAFKESCDNEGDRSSSERFEHYSTEPGSGGEESASENANSSWTYRSSLHIPMEQMQDNVQDPQLQEILIKFPLMALDSGEPQAGQPNVTVTSPRRELEVVPTKQGAAELPSGHPDITAKRAERSSEPTPCDQGDKAIAELEPRDGLTETSRAGAAVTFNEKKMSETQKDVPTPSGLYPLREADVSEGDSTPPPLPLSPPPKSAAQLLLVAHDEVAAKNRTAVTDSHAVASQNKEGKMEYDPTTECGEVANETGAVATGTSAVVANTGAAINSDTKAADSSVVEVDDDAKTEADREDADAATQKNDNKKANADTGAAEGDVYSPEGSAAALRRHSVGDKQHQRLGNLVRRRRSRKMSMDKEYHDMKRKLTVANAGLVPHYHAASDNNQGTEEMLQNTGTPNGSSEEPPNSEPSCRNNVTKHPGRLAKSRRKSRPLSLDAEYYAMKSKLQVHNGHPGGHDNGHEAACDAQGEAAGVCGSDHTAGYKQPSAPAGRSTDSVPTLSTVPAPVSPSQTRAATPANAVQSPAKAALRRSSGRLSMDKEFFAMRAQLALHADGQHGSAVPMSPPVSSAPGFEPEEPRSPPPSPVSGVRVLQTRRGSRRMSIEEEFFAARAAHRARHPVQSESDEQSPPISPKIQSHSCTTQGQAVVPKERLELRASAGRSVASPSLATTRSSQDKKLSSPTPVKKPSQAFPATSQTLQQAQASKPPTPAPPSSTVQMSAHAPPNPSTQLSPASQTITLAPGHLASATPAAGDRCSVRQLPLDPELLALRAHSERPPAGPVPRSPPTSPATPPPSPTSVLSRSDRPGSIRRRVQELEHSAAEEDVRSQLRQSTPAPFSRTGRAGSVRDRIRRMEQLQRGQNEAATAGAAAAEGSPVALRRHSTHSPFTRLGSGGGGGVSSLTVRLQSSPPGPAQRGSLSPSGPQPPTPVQRGGARQRRSLPDAGMWGGSRGTPEPQSRASLGRLGESGTIPEQHCGNTDDLEKYQTTHESMADVSPVPKSAVASPSALNKSQSFQTTPPKPAARHAPEKTPSPPELVAWPWTPEDEAAEAKRAQHSDQKSSDVSPTESSPEQPVTSRRSDRSSPSAYETANESSFSPRASVSEPRQAREAVPPEQAVAARERAVSEGPEASSGTEVDAQDDDVFADSLGTPTAGTAAVTSL